MPCIVNAILQNMSDAPPIVGAEKQGFIHITIPVGILQCNCSIIGDPVTREALVVDPGDEVGRILELLGRHKLTVKAIVPCACLRTRSAARTADSMFRRSFIASNMRKISIPFAAARSTKLSTTSSA